MITQDVLNDLSKEKSNVENFTKASSASKSFNALFDVVDISIECELYIKELAAINANIAGANDIENAYNLASKINDLCTKYSVIDILSKQDLLQMFKWYLSFCSMICDFDALHEDKGSKIAIIKQAIKRSKHFVPIIEECINKKSML